MLPLHKNTVVDFSPAIVLPPNGGRGISESVDWMEFGREARNVNNEGFALRVPGKDKCILNYQCDGDWAPPAFFSVQRLCDADIRVIKPWHEHVLPGVTSVTLQRTPWSEADMVVYLADKTILPRSSWTLQGRVVTLQAQSVMAFVEYRPVISCLLVQKQHSGSEWSGKVGWSLQFKEK